MAKKANRLRAWEERCKQPIHGKRNPYKRTPKGRKSRPKPPPFDWSSFLRDDHSDFARQACSCPTAGCRPCCDNRARFNCPFHGQDMIYPCDCDEMSTVIRM